MEPPQNLVAEDPKAIAVGEKQTHFTKVPPRFHQDSPSFVVSLALWGRSVLGCHKVQGSIKVLQVSWRLCFSGADPFWAAKRFCGRFHQV